MITQVRDGVLGPGLKALEQRFGPVGGPPWGQMRTAWEHNATSRSPTIDRCQLIASRICRFWAVAG